MTLAASYKWLDFMLTSELQTKPSHTPQRRDVGTDTDSKATQETTNEVKELCLSAGADNPLFL